ncbi:unnamed protein product [Strongylus vulgaris]|uniref:Uncharacterized protein n=1 Tax=Strongylus vulgaris TaxID=40348 RepID=A0A3P7JBY6_STRVU|nr:unnamed protein product [Strongylus vulgaris]
MNSHRSVPAKNSFTASDTPQPSLRRILPRPALTFKSPQRYYIPNAFLQRLFVLSQPPTPRRLTHTPQLETPPYNITFASSVPAHIPSQEPISTAPSPVAVDTAPNQISVTVSSNPVSGSANFRGKIQVAVGAMRSRTIKPRCSAKSTDVCTVIKKVIDDNFQTDSCMPRHCIPKGVKTNYVERYLYQKLQIRSDVNLADARMAGHARCDAFAGTFQSGQEEVEEIMNEFHQTGYGTRRRTIAESMMSMLVYKLCRTMFILEVWRSKIARGLCSTVFRGPKKFTGWLTLPPIQPTRVVHLLLKENTPAVDNGLTAFVADGMHRLSPEMLSKDGLYTIHGVCNGVVSRCPAHTRAHKEEKPFHVREGLQQAGDEGRVRARLVDDHLLSTSSSPQKSACLLPTDRQRRPRRMPEVQEFSNLLAEELV